VLIEAARPGALLATPLLLALIMVEFHGPDLPVDSIPAIFAITADPFCVTSKRVCHPGLRSLYFALAGMIDRFPVPEGVAGVRADDCGVKMMTHGG